MENSAPPGYYLVGSMNELDLNSPTGVCTPDDCESALPSMDRFTLTDIPGDARMVHVGAQHAPFEHRPRRVHSVFVWLKR